MTYLELERREFDVCVVGSGASGGTAAMALCEAGAKVCVLEIGPWRDPGKDFRGHIRPYELAHRGHQSEYVSHIYGDPETYRYSSPDKDGATYIILPAVGGKTLLWGAYSWRFGPRDFQLRTQRGVGEDWPFSYHELAPHYDRAERFMGVCGSRDHVAALPDGQFLPPLKLRCGEELIGRSLGKLGPHLKMISARKAINTVPFGGRPPCHWCGHCMKGCDVDAKWTAANSAIPAALRTGRCTLVTGAMAKQILLDRAGNRANAVVFRDLQARVDRRIHCRAVALAAGPVETARLLLLSKSRWSPQGLANGSGQVGRNLQTTIGMATAGYLKPLVGSGAINDDGTDPFHAHIPNPYYENPHPDFPNGYIINVGSGTQIASVGGRGLDFGMGIPGFGAKFKKQFHDIVPALVVIGCQGQTIESPNNFVDLDPELSDGFGLPAIRLHFRLEQTERAMINDMWKLSRALIEAAGGVVLTREPSFGIDPSHYEGTCRMGSNASGSVLNPDCRSHEVKNVFVVDGSSFPAYPEKNPTLSIVATALRAAGKLAEQLRKGEI